MLAEHLADYREVEKEKAKRAKKYNERLKQIREQMDEVGDAVRNGHEFRNVDCSWVPVYSAGLDILIRQDTKAVVQKRKRAGQMNLGDAEAQAAADEQLEEMGVVIDFPNLDRLPDDHALSEAIDEETGEAHSDDLVGGEDDEAEQEDGPIVFAEGCHECGSKLVALEAPDSDGNYSEQPYGRCESYSDKATPSAPDHGCIGARTYACGCCATNDDEGVVQGFTCLKHEGQELGGNIETSTSSTSSEVEKGETPAADTETDDSTGASCNFTIKPKVNTLTDTPMGPACSKCEKLEPQAETTRRWGIGITDAGNDTGVEHAFDVNAPMKETQG